MRSSSNLFNAAKLDSSSSTKATIRIVMFGLLRVRILASYMRLLINIILLRLSLEILFKTSQIGNDQLMFAIFGNSEIRSSVI
jgi:hypothetical protein